jgi:parallel beta-helix repeat protein
MPNVKAPAFFSYARTDAADALRLAADLKKAGANVWLDQVDIPPGRPWDREVEHALRVCDEMLLILSPASVDSVNVMDEVSFALQQRKTVIPLLFQECQIPLRLHRLQYIDFRSDYEDGLRRLLRSLAAENQVQVPPGPPATEPLPGGNPDDSRAVLRVNPASREYNTIMAAVRAAAEGDRILVEEGTYRENVVLHKPVEIIGEGDRETVIIESDDGNAVSFDAPRGRISNLTIRHSGNSHSAVKITRGRLLLEECDITSRGLSCVSIQYDADPTVRGNRIHGGRQEGLYAGEGAAGLIEDNEIFENGLAGVAVWRGASPAIRGNEIYGCKEGIYIGDGGRGIIEENRIHHNRGPAIKTEGGEPTLRPNQDYQNAAGGL